jgi:hypothetical protein
MECEPTSTNPRETDDATEKAYKVLKIYLIKYITSVLTVLEGE